MAACSKERSYLKIIMVTLECHEIERNLGREEGRGKKAKKVIRQVCLTAELDVSILERQVEVLEGVFSHRTAGKTLP